jgi:DNA-binding HxlR family transcriptional regulator
MQPIHTEPIRQKVEFESCPVQASLEVLGRRWAFLVLRNIALYRAQRYTEMLRATRGMSKRVLTNRLNELERAGFIVREESRRGYVRWELTEKGADVMPVLLTLVEFGSKWHASEVFADKRPRPLEAIFDESYVRETMRRPPGSAGYGGGKPGPESSENRPDLVPIANA